MKQKVVSMFWGAALVVLGAVFLITGRTSFSIQDPLLGLLLFGGLSLLFFTSYFLSGVERWGWLFPAFIFAGLAVMVLFFMPAGSDPGPQAAAPLFISIAIPFIIAYLLDRRRWWALIPTWVMLVLTGMMFLVDRAPGELVGSFFLLATALPFLVVFLINRRQRWALIPFGVIAVVGLIPMLTLWFKGEAIAPVIMFLFAVPFLVVYFWRPQNWWALIPAGVFVTIGVMVMIAALQPEANREGASFARMMSGGLFLGWALTFLLLWLRRGSAPTAWAIYPAAVVGALGLLAVITGEAGLNVAWPLALILGGALLLWNNYRRKQV